MSNQVLEHLPTAGKVTGEVVALGMIGGTLLEWLPTIAAGVAILWHGVLFYDWASVKFGRREGDNKKE